jgi:uncharacterized protein YdeI (YjbR/CyaY-like superfamily)
LGYYKKGTGKPSVTWPESVDQALCFGWIDGIRKSIDDESYQIRFTPRKPKSIWSAVNIKRAHELTEEGLMRPNGLKAFQARLEAKSEVYAYEQREAPAFPASYQGQLQADSAAWAFFQSQPPSYQRGATWWVISAKQEETRLKRLATLIADSAQGRTVKPLTPPGKRVPER